MINQKLIKLKKYLFLISILFLFLSTVHLSYVYLYENAEVVPIKGGTVSEGLVGNFPSLNPIKPLSGNNEYLVSLLYRSILKYDVEENKIVGDIANCDISSLVNIECYINENTLWSNGEKITAEDIVKTYELIKSTESNPIISSLLQDTTIENKGNIIVFKNIKKDVNFLNIFFQPILSKQVIDVLTEENIYGNFPSKDLIYSGDFVISNISSDLTIGVSQINLYRNPNYNNGNVSKLTVNIYPDNNTLLKNKHSVNIFNDIDNIIGNTIPRLGSNKYTLPQFVGLFINQESITNNDLRNFIFNKINSENLIELLGKDNYKVVNNPYLKEDSISKDPSNRNFEAIMSSLGYQKKSKFIESIPTQQNSGENEEKITQENSENLSDLSYDEIIEKYQQKLVYLYGPSYIEKYNFITKENILLEGKVDPNVDAVYVNDYKLQGYKKGDTKFIYRLSLGFSTIKEGENYYKIYFETSGNKELKEEVFFYYNTQKSIVDNEKEKFFKGLYEKDKEENKKQEVITTEKNNEKIELNNQALELLEKYNKLDEKIYYNKDLNPYTLKLYFLNSQKDLEYSANFIQNSLKEIGINIELSPFELKDISKIITSKSDYDMILTGINLGYFDFNIFPYFHSSQATNGYNFSNIKRTSLDLLLEDLKSNIYGVDKTNEISTKILEILKDEQVIKTLYTPKINLLVDKNLKNTQTIDYLPNTTLRSYILNSIYIREDKSIKFENKSINQFFKFLFKKLYG